MTYYDLSKRQVQILEYIVKCVEQTQLPPSVREIGEAIGLSSPSSVHVHLKVLEDKGYIKRRGSKSRSMTLTDKAWGQPQEHAAEPTLGKVADFASDSKFSTLPLVGRVAAGEPILAEQNIEEEVALPISLVGDRNSFLLTVRGDSMVNAGILDGDIVIVREQKTAQDGDIVVALIEDGATVKTFFQEKDCIRLQPQNPALEPIFTRDAEIIGVVTGLFRSM